MTKYQYFLVHHYRWFHALRVTISCAIVLIISSLFDIPYGSWAIITCVVVQGPHSHLGAVKARAKQRILGTIIGIVVGLGLLYMPFESEVSHSIAMLGALLIMIYFTQSKYPYMALVASITMVIVSTPGPEDLIIAEWRSLNIIWGTVIALGVSYMVLPTKASHLFQMQVKQSLNLLAKIYPVTNIPSLRDITRHSRHQVIKVQHQQRALLPLIVNEHNDTYQAAYSALQNQRKIISLMEAIIFTQWDFKRTLPNDLIISIEANAKYLKHLKEDFPIEQEEQLFACVIEDADRTEIAYLWLHNEIQRLIIELEDAIKKLNSASSVH